MNESTMGTLSSWQAEYRRSLKALETEEPLDLLIYRPLAFVVAKVFARTSVTANHVSLASLFCGLLSGVLFWQGSHRLAVLAAGTYFLCNVLDCADGQLARIKGSSSPLGYIVDGSIDYLATIAVFLGMGHSMALAQPENAGRWWLIATAWICSYGWQCALLDRKRHEWMARVYKRRSDPEKEIVEFRRQAEVWRQEGTNLGGRALIALYLFNKVSWARIIPSADPTPPADEDTVRWAELNRPVLRMAVMIGSTMQMTLIMIAALANRFDLMLWTTLTLGNVWGIMTLVLERQAAQKLAESPRAE
jgi:phosphatidylglycerophosphate synthase